MVYTCVVFGCKTRRKPDVERSFHCFPHSDPERLQQWINVVSLKGPDGKLWRPNRNSRICSDHFVASDYEAITNRQRRFLLKTAVPSIFPTYPRHKQPSRKECRKPPRKRPLPLLATRPSRALLLKSVKHDHTYHCPSIDEDLRRTREALEKAKDTIMNKNKKIDALTMKVQRRDLQISNVLEEMENSLIVTSQE